MTVGTGKGLSAEELAAYCADGQVTPAFTLDPDLLLRVREAAEALVTARADLRPEFIPLPHVPWDDSDAARVLSGQFLDLARRPEILDLVESVIGPDIIFWTAALFCKPSGDGREVAWHQDGIYWPLKPMATVTLWLALDESSEENGCMRVLPGSHTGGFLEHVESGHEGLVLNTMIEEAGLDLSRTRSIELKAGQVSLHDAYLVHGSSPNTSSKRRAGLTLRYMPATSLYDRTRPMGTASNTAPVAFVDRPVWLVRGVDRAGNNFAIGH